MCVFCRKPLFNKVGFVVTGTPRYTITSFRSTRENTASERTILGHTISSVLTTRHTQTAMSLATPRRSTVVNTASAVGLSTTVGLSPTVWLSTVAARQYDGTSEPKQSLAPQNTNVSDVTLLTSLQTFIDVTGDKKTTESATPASVYNVATTNRKGLLYTEQQIISKSGATVLSVSTPNRSNANNERSSTSSKRPLTSETTDISSEKGKIITDNTMLDGDAGA